MPDAREMRALAWLAAASAVLLVAIPLDLWPGLRGPAPYPPEWQWDLRPLPLPVDARLLPALTCGGLLLLLLAALPRLGTPTCRQSALSLCAASLLGFGLQLGLLHLEPAGARRTLIARAMSRTSTSYLTVAVSEVADSPLGFLRRHAQLLPEFRREAKHAATHPPGPVLYYRAALGLCRSLPALGNLLVPEPAPGRVTALPEVRAAALLGALFLCLLAAFTCVPIALLARSLGAPLSVALQTAALWSLLPGPLLMAPHFDAPLAFPVVAVAALLVFALRTLASRAAAAMALLAGFASGSALYVSYGALAFLGLAALAATAATWHPGAAQRTSLVAILAAAGVGSVFGVAILLGHQPWQAARTALGIHAELYTQPRSYTLWLLWNPLDLALFLGLPIALFGLGQWVLSSGAPAEAPGRFRLALALGLLALIASGQVRGEVGRIWIPLMALLLVVAAPRRHGPAAALLGVLLLAQTLAMHLCWSVG